MASFTIRVELHNADSEDYDKLEKLLAAYLITDVIAADDGTLYRLPPAEYNYQGEKGRNEVMETVKAVAAQVVPSYAVLVSESRSREWYGLKRIT